LPELENFSPGEIHLKNFKDVFNGKNMRERQEEYLKKLRKIIKTGRAKRYRN